MKLNSVPLVLALLVALPATGAAQDTDGEGIGTGYGALSIGIDLFNVTTIAVNIPARSTNRVGGLVGLLGGATGIAIGASKLGESGATLAVGAVNMWVGAAAALFGVMNITTGRAPGQFALGEDIRGEPIVGRAADGNAALGVRLSF